MSGDRVHATLGASSAHRWMACPGSIRLSEGQPNYESDYAREGTVAHELAECWLATPPGTEIPGIEKYEEDMIEGVRVFVDYCRDLMDRADRYWLEHGFNLAKLNPPAPMFGYNDFAAVVGHTLEVVDLKYGKGVVVEVIGNKQLRYYALGALLALEDSGLVIDEVKITIVQPRVAHRDGVVRSETLSVVELLDFSADLLAAAQATQEIDAPLVVGSHCRFCPALAICPAQAENAQALAQVEFADLPVDRPPAPDTLPVDVLADILQKAPILESWLSAARARAQRLLEQGEEVPGFKLVARRATRRWTDEVSVQNWLEEQGYDPEDITTRELKSPAQIEKVMGRRKKELPTEFVVKKSSGYTLAPEHDIRPEVTLTPGEEFLALPSGEPNGQDIEESL